tara:strand:+ start:168 stop:731 length:564 start_codon:yes stop_codon:yes gene_type:complete
MVYLLIAIVILMIAAPIMAVLPSKRDKARMQKRRQAMGRGIGIEMTNIEDPDMDPNKYLSSTGKPLERRLSVVAYRLQRRKPADQRKHQEARWRALAYPAKKRTPITERWCWEDAPPSSALDNLVSFLRSNLDELPADVVLVEEKNYFISVYWHEVGEVREVIDFLERCVQIWSAEIDPEDKLLGNL